MRHTLALLLGLPPLIAPFTAPGISIYPKEPVVNETEVRGTVSGERVESVTYVAEAGGRHTPPPICLRWFNLKENRIGTAMADGFELAVRGPPPVTPPPSFDWRAVAPWMVLGALFVALAAVRGRDFAGCLRAIDLWKSRIPAGSVGDHSQLSFALAQLGAGLYGHDRHPPLGSQWNTAVAALRAARQKYLGAPVAGRVLPPLNPRMVT